MHSDGNGRPSLQPTSHWNPAASAYDIALCHVACPALSVPSLLAHVRHLTPIDENCQGRHRVRLKLYLLVSDRQASLHGGVEVDSVFLRSASSGRLLYTAAQGNA